MGIIGGSGLDDPANKILNDRVEIPQKSVENEFGSPSSNLYHGKIGDVEVVLLSR